MEKPKVLILGKIEHALTSWAHLHTLATIIAPSPSSTTRSAFLSECASGAFAGATVIYRTFESVAQTGRIDGELLALLPPSLRFICHNGAGYDQIDVGACRARGIRVSHTPAAVDDSTSDIALFLLLGALRNLGPGMASLRMGCWRRGALPALGHDPRGKVLGILGMGGIGRNVARKAAAFGMRVRYHNRTRLGQEVERACGGAEHRGFEELLREADVLSLNLPLNAKTHHIISHPQFALMKPGIVLVNTARGAVIDESALVSALASGRVSSAGLDVYEHEPAVHPGLLANPRVLLVPHMGTWTVETQARMEEATVANVREALERGRLRSVVPEMRDMEEDGDDDVDVGEVEEVEGKGEIEEEEEDEDEEEGKGEEV
ncbi:glyoxylate reductase [Whalleya microplaca]|nr:glyoxylate reductase [Whalleya microplaca]